tara:strand:+ start:40 stop:210 length:171 start_codon:yes stop_codon:yes gene_type:complete
MSSECNIDRENGGLQPKNQAEELDIHLNYDVIRYHYYALLALDIVIFVLGNSRNNK